MSNILFKNISNFIDLDNSDLTVTKVRISTDGGDTWGTLYEGNPVVKRDIVYDPNVVIIMKPCIDCEDYGRGECSEHWQGWNGWVEYTIVETHKDGSTNEYEDGFFTNYYDSSGTYTENHTITYAGEEYDITLTITVNDYEPIQVRLRGVWNENDDEYEDDKVTRIFIPYNSSATYKIGYDVYEDGEHSTEGTIEHTFNYEDYEDGTNTITIQVEHMGKYYPLTFEFNVELQKYRWSVKQDPDKTTRINLYTESCADIHYAVYRYDIADDYTEDWDYDSISSKDYNVDYIMSKYGYENKNDINVTVTETHTIDYEGEECTFTAEVHLYFDSMVYCSDCCEYYDEDKYDECPNCSEYGDSDEDEDEEDTDIITCPDCGNTYDNNKYIECPRCEANRVRCRECGQIYDGYNYDVCPYCGDNGREEV